MLRVKSRLPKRRDRHDRQSFIIILSIFLSVIFIFTLVFCLWMLMMPPSGTADIPDELPEFHHMLAEQIKNDVIILADSIGQRNMHTPGSMDASVNFINQRFTSMGYEAESHLYTLRRGIYAGSNATNIIAEIPGSEREEDIIIIGAHYDTVFNSPGANDNASGIAVLLSLAEKFTNFNPVRTIRFLAFANEEPPFFQTTDMGSYAYAERSRDQNENIIAMIALDGLGYFDDEPGSQNYPLPGLGLAYPDKAEFIGLVTRISDLKLLRRIAAGFNKRKLIPTQSAALPGFLPGVNWSDHWSFWKQDYSAILITDTLLFRDPYYHTANDTPERLNYEQMAHITLSLVTTIQQLDSD